LASEFELPQLTPSSPDTPHWILRLGGTPPPLDAATVIGEDRIEHISHRLLRHDAGFRLEYEDTGIFDVSADGREIWWYEKPGVDRDLLCADLTGKVLAVSLHIGGKLSLHGSAVVLEGQGLAFLAPKGFGKSTLSMALTAAGARLASDDMVTVGMEEPITASPGLDSVRLWRHTAEALQLDEGRLTIGAGRKYTVSQFPEGKLVRERFPLAAIYLLTPVQASPAAAGPAASRTLLDPVSAVMSLVTNTKLGPLLGDTEAAVVLRRAATVTRSVPVFTLSVVRDFDRLGEVVDQVFAWHGAVSSRESLLEVAS
jgi:hypothetical protein